MFRIFCLLIGYLVGCVQTAYIVGKIMAKIDIREHGSGNAGTTNVVRVLGTRTGFLVFVCDILKAVVAYLICSAIFKGSGTFFGSDKMNVLPGLYAGLGVILGHNFPFFLNFKGGKGSASGLGVILCVNIVIAIISYIVGIITVASTRYISLASLLITLSFTILLFVFGYPLEVCLLALSILLLSSFQHRGNIKRLINGNERKFTFKPEIDKNILK